jgi:hypothetical protein
LVAVNNTPKAKALIIKYGYRPARNYNDLIRKLTTFTREFREEALKELVEIHPHKDLILNFNQPITSEKKSNCEGDEMCDKCKQKQQQYLSFEGNQTPIQTTPNTTSQNVANNDLKSMLPTIAITSLITASLVILISRAK